MTAFYYAEMTAHHIYGAGKSVENALSGLKKAYLGLGKRKPDTFEEAMDFYGGHVRILRDGQCGVNDGTDRVVICPGRRSNGIDVFRGDGIVCNNLRVFWVRLGEGFRGDYNPEDPDDEELLRFDVEIKHGKSWELLDDASYCTCMPVTCLKEMRQYAAKFTMAHVEPFVKSGASVKRVCEWLSWMEPGWFAPGVAVNMLQPGVIIKLGDL